MPEVNNVLTRRPVDNKNYPPRSGAERTTSGRRNIKHSPKDISAGLENWFQAIPRVQRYEIDDILRELNIPSYSTETRISYEWNILQLKALSNPNKLKQWFDAEIQQVQRSGNKARLDALMRVRGIVGLIQSPRNEQDRPQEKPPKKEVKPTKTEQPTLNRSWNDHIDTRKKTVLRLAQEGKIDERKKQRYLEHIDSQVTNHDRLFNFNGLTFEGLTLSEQSAVLEVLKSLPIELVGHIKSVSAIPEKEYGAMCYYGSHQFGEGRVKIKKKSFGYDSETFALSLLHEVGGHGLRNMMEVLDRRAYQRIAHLLNQVSQTNPNLLNKDTYYRNIRNGSSYKDRLRNNGTIWASVDEFWTDRMAEYWRDEELKKQGRPAQSKLNRDKNNPFTPQEEELCKKVCREMVKTWEQALQKKKNKVHEKMEKKSKKERQRANADYYNKVVRSIQEQGFYDGPVLNGVFPGSKNIRHFEIPLLVDRRGDPVLTEMIAKAKSLKFLPKEKRWMALMQLVDAYTTSPDDNGNAKTWEHEHAFKDWYMKQVGSNVKRFPVRLGDFTNRGRAGGAGCRERAIFIQLLGHEASLQPRLRIGTLKRPHHVEGASGSHAWNEAIENGGPVVIETYRASRRKGSWSEHQKHYSPKTNMSGVRSLYYANNGGLAYAI